MGKTKASKEVSSRLLKRLEPYNKSPSVRNERQRSEDVDSARSRSKSSELSKRDRHRSRSRSRSESSGVSSRRRHSNEPPAWAKEILGNQQKNAEELQRLQCELAKSKSAIVTAPKVAEPTFRYQGNKKQYEVNKSVLEHVERALASRDVDEITQELNEGKRILEERNKHILLAEKYGWDMVHCYTAEPLASDSEDEKRIRKAIKEGKHLKGEKKAEALRFKPKKQTRPTERQSFGAESRFYSGQGTKAGKFQSQSSRDQQALTCFRCFRPGHIARECRSANSRFVIASSTQTNQN